MTPITDCQPNAQQLAPLKESTNNYDVGDANGEWPHNCISRKTVVYDCGVIARNGNPKTHCHDPEELALVRSLADSAAKLMDGTEVEMGSDSIDYFVPFYICANIGDDVPDIFDPESIRSLFGGTIYPPARITIEPLQESGDWWQQLRDDYVDNEEYQDDDVAVAYGHKLLDRWQAMVRWFNNEHSFKTTCCVRIGENPLDDEIKNLGCVFPRLALGVTINGSVAGICSHVVHT
jgi:hypothetical protein